MWILTQAAPIVDTQIAVCQAEKRRITYDTAKILGRFTISLSYKMYNMLRSNQAKCKLYCTWTLNNGGNVQKLERTRYWTCDGCLGMSSNVWQSDIRNLFAVNIWLQFCSWFTNFIICPFYLLSICTSVIFKDVIYSKNTQIMCEYSNLNVIDVIKILNASKTK